jgi:integrase/recombinase XerD
MDWPGRRITWLFPGNRWHSGDQPIDTKTVWNACKEAAERAGIQKDVHPHTLRHYADLDMGATVSPRTSWKPARIYEPL